MARLGGSTKQFNYIVAETEGFCNAKKENIDVKAVIEKLEGEAGALYQSLLATEVALFYGPFTMKEYEYAIAANTASAETLYQKLKALMQFLYELDRGKGKSADACGFEME